MEFPSGLAGEESRVVTAVAAVTAVAQVQSLVQEIPHAVGTAEKKKKKKRHSKPTLRQIKFSPQRVMHI